jgi:hypothetical protein
MEGVMAKYECPCGYVYDPAEIINGGSYGKI